MGFSLGGGKLLIQNKETGEYAEMGTIKAAMLNRPDGSKMVLCGKPEDVFDLRLNDGDKNLLAGMNISK